MSATITQAVLAKFAASGQAEFSKLWFDELPENQTLPFVGFFHEGEAPEYTFEGGYKEEGSFSFQVNAVGIAETERLALVVMAIYDACIVNPVAAFSIVGQKVFAWRRKDYKISSAQYRPESGDLVGEATFGYEYSVNKQLPT